MPMEGNKLLIREPTQNPGDDFAYRSKTCSDPLMGIGKSEGGAVLDVAAACCLFHQHRRQPLGYVLQGELFQQRGHLSQPTGQNTQGCKGCLRIVEQKAPDIIFCQEQNHGIFFGHYCGRVGSIIKNRDFRKCGASAFHMDGLFPAFLALPESAERAGNSHVQSRAVSPPTKRISP